MTAPVNNANKVAKAEALKANAANAAKNMFAVSTIQDNSENYPKFKKSELTLGKVLGKGGFGTVHEILGFCEPMGDSSRRSSKRSSKRMSKINGDAGAGGSQDAQVAEGEMEGRDFIAKHCIRNGGDARYAVKFLSPEVVAKEDMFFQGMIDMAVETRFLSDIEHPNIIKMRAIGDCNPCDENYFICMDRLYDTLEKRVKQWGKRKSRSNSFAGKMILDRKGTKSMQCYEERVVAAFDLSAAVGYLHSRNIIYRDLKPENIGFDVRGDIKLFDFGLAKELNEKQKQPDGLYKLTGLTGSLRYMAPEVANEQPYNETCDVYSFGILFWEILACAVPYEMYTPKALRAKVYNAPHKRPIVQEAWPSTMKLLMKKSWSPNIEERYTMEAITKILRNECVRVRKGDDSGLEHERRRSTFVFRGNQRV